MLAMPHVQVWELLVGQKPRRDLLQLHDLQSSTRLQSLSASASLSPEEFDAKFNSDGSFAFTFPGSDGLCVFPAVLLFACTCHLICGNCCAGLLS